MFKESLNFEDYKKFKEKFNSFILDEQWRYSLMFDCFLSDNIRNETLSMINFFKANPDPYKVSKYLDFLREQSVKLLQESENQVSVKNAWAKVREAYAYYGFGEVITEGSVYSESLMQELQKVYGDKYLSVLSRIDKIVPSKLTNFSQINNDNLLDDNDAVKKYLLLKKWQDEQNIYHNKILYPIFSKYRDEYKKEYISKHEEIECSAREMLILAELREQSILPIDTLAIWIDIGVGNELTSIVGGKNYGLAILRQQGLNIPNTWTLTLNSTLNEEFISSLPSMSKYAVRSSANGEDGQKNSFAGMFDTILDVSKDNILKAVEEVKQSCRNSRVQSYIQKFNLKQPEMSIVIQEFIPADISGVWLGREEASGILEWVKGRGDQLVSGKITPTTEIVNTKSNDDGLQVNGKNVGDILLKYQKKLGKICDFEFCIKDDKLYMLQYRPVTEIIAQKKQDDNSSIIGTPASRGVVAGEICFLEDVEDIDKFKPNTILLTYYTDPDWVEAMVKAKAIVTAEGGFLCHTAIIARELGIPCITGIGNKNLRKLAQLKNIVVNGDTGGIKEYCQPKKKELDNKENRNEQNFEL